MVVSVLVLTSWSSRTCIGPFICRVNNKHKPTLCDTLMTVSVRCSGVGGTLEGSLCDGEGRKGTEGKIMNRDASQLCVNVDLVLLC